MKAIMRSLDNKELERGDSNQLDRLFFQYIQETGLIIDSCHVLKKNVVKLQTEQGPKVLKGFKNKEKLHGQLLLGSILDDRNEKVAASFEPFPTKEWFFHYDGLYWACMPVEEGTPLDFSKRADRLLGLRQIAKFHKETGNLTKDVAPLKLFQLNEKWLRRYNRFQLSLNQAPIQKEFVPLASSVQRWGEWILERINRKFLQHLEVEALNNRSLIHGDVAHHNFLRNKFETVLIDFDLIAYAPLEYDYLQYINRIMPFLKWDLQEVRDIPIPGLKHCLQNPDLYLLLAFPTDFFREWLFLMRTNEQKLNNYLAYARQKFQERERFFIQVQKAYYKRITYN
ncbi:phosphotransferase [Pseudalkalibacillus caeni]|uniref:phosphotransferase n=1 Tax=Exobacillus caeni TaxID=2574798 RepID=UPI00148581DD|nr:phosphotransferase [Pseudalkalibacillus caeni]